MKSRDVIFNEAETWRWNNDSDKEVVMEESEVENQQTQPMPPSPPQTPLTKGSSSRGTPSTARSFNLSSLSQTPIKMKSLREIYEHTEEDGETNLFCL